VAYGNLSTVCAQLWSLPMVESNMPDSLKVVGHSYDSSSVIGFTKRRKL
jgi:hypothetical protein